MKLFMKKYDLIIVGSGLFGAIFAYEATKLNKKCLIIEKRNHLGGNIFTKEIEGINVHKYGAHIFHTNNKFIWDYMNSFVEFNRFTNSPMAYFNGKLYNLPFNMNTFYQLWGVKTPEEAKKKIELERSEYSHIKNPQNLEEQALILAGKDIYKVLIKGYTEKQWGREATKIPAFIIRRIPFRFNFDNNYFNDPYQGIPMGGYTKIIEKMLKNCDVLLDTDYLENKDYYDKLADNTIYTGKIDEYYKFKYGKLEYRSLKFEEFILDTDNYQGNAVVNYTESNIPFTRIIEHKHFEFGNQPKTVITKEFPCEFDGSNEAFYPINDEINQSIYEKYKMLAEKEKNVLFGGRLAEYKYYDMDKIVESALNAFCNYLKI